jgi:hypothetical protein
MSTPVLHAALGYMGRGWPVAPIYGPDPTRSTGCSCPDPECSSPAKHPTTRQGILDASTEERLARIWWERHPGRGVALATGEPSGVWVLDLDGEEGKRTFLALQEDHPPLPRTPASRTGGGGFHLFFRMPGDRDVRNSAGKLGHGIDVRGTGGYVLLPPSGHVSGRRYQWVAGRSPDDLQVALAPIWLLDLMAPPMVEMTAPAPPPMQMGRRYVQRAIEDECMALASTPEGSRNERLNRAAFALARFVGTGEADAASVARALAYAAAQAGLEAREIARTLESAFSARGVA